MASYRFARGDYARFSVYGYNTEDERYRRALGKLLTHRIGQILKELGYRTEIARGQSNGVDLKVWRNGNLLLVAETKNFNVKTKLPFDKKKNIIENLSEYPDSKKYLIYTQMANEEILADLGTKGISTLKIGYQLMPAWFYDSTEINERCYRQIDSRKTSLDIKHKLARIIAI